MRRIIIGDGTQLRYQFNLSQGTAYIDESTLTHHKRLDWAVFSIPGKHVAFCQQQQTIEEGSDVDFT